MAAAAAVAAVQLAAAYHNRGRARLQFGWKDDAWEDFAIAGGIASASQPVHHGVRKVIQIASRQAASATTGAASATAAAEGGNHARKKKKQKKVLSMLL